MESMISYIFLGLSLAAPIGPVNAAQIDKGIKNGFLHSWLLGIGAMAADGLYMLLVYLGVVHLLSIGFVKSFLWFFGCFVLTYTGIESMIAANQPISGLMRNKEKLSKSFLTGFLMSLTNPLTILFWLGVYGSVLAKTAESVGPQQFLLYSLAIFIGGGAVGFFDGCRLKQLRKTANQPFDSFHFEAVRPVSCRFRHLFRHSGGQESVA